MRNKAVYVDDPTISLSMWLLAGRRMRIHGTVPAGTRSNSTALSLQLVRNPASEFIQYTDFNLQYRILRAVEKKDRQTLAYPAEPKLAHGGYTQPDSTTHMQILLSERVTRAPYDSD